MRPHPCFALAQPGPWRRAANWLNPLGHSALPPLRQAAAVYWLMALVYALPGQEQWNPLGTWPHELPSGLASIGVMLNLAFHAVFALAPSPGDQSGEQHKPDHAVEATRWALTALTDTPWPYAGSPP